MVILESLNPCSCLQWLRQKRKIIRTYNIIERRTVTYAGNPTITFDRNMNDERCYVCGISAKVVY